MKTKHTRYKAWHTTKKQMFFPYEMARDQLTLLPDGTGFINVSSANTMLSQLIPEMIPLEYTGMLDKNHNDICEGDIVKVWDSDGDPFKRLILIEWNEDTSSWGLGHISNNLSIEYSYEIVGNIFENPELLDNN